MVRLFLLADKLCLTDPDVTWLPFWWAYKASIILGF